MSGAELNATEDLIAVAKTVRTRGLKGELVADLLTDFPDRFERLEKLIGVSPTGQRVDLELEKYWFRDKRLIVKFAGYDSIEDAKKLVGFELTVPEDERVELDEDEFYDWELEGCKVVTVEGNTVGVVIGVLRTGGVGILTIKDDKDREVLVPLAEDICVEIDVEAKLIQIDPPDGLLEM